MNKGHYLKKKENEDEMVRNWQILFNFTEPDIKIMGVLSPLSLLSFFFFTETKKLLEHVFAVFFIIKIPSRDISLV